MRAAGGPPAAHVLRWAGVLQALVRDAADASLAELLHRASRLLTDERKERIRSVAAGRSYAVVPVLEGLYDVGNLSAIMRTADALGLQAVHMINRMDDVFKHRRNVSKGSEHWLDLRAWSSTSECLDWLRGRGYRIVLADASPAAVPLQDVDFSHPTALVFGNEFKGVSAEAAQAADAICKIPISGFTESLNVSVAAAIMMHHARLAADQHMSGQPKDSSQLALELETEFALRAVLRSRSMGTLPPPRLRGPELLQDPDSLAQLLAGEQTACLGRLTGLSQLRKAQDTGQNS